MSTPRLYRFALRAYPAAYRAERAPELMATLAEGDAERGGPSLREAASLVRRGIALRVRPLGVPDWLLVARRGAGDDCSRRRVHLGRARLRVQRGGRRVHDGRSRTVVGAGTGDRRVRGARRDALRRARQPAADSGRRGARRSGCAGHLHRAGRHLQGGRPKSRGAARLVRLDGGGGLPQLDPHAARDDRRSGGYLGGAHRPRATRARDEAPRAGHDPGFARRAGRRPDVAAARPSRRVRAERLGGSRRGGLHRGARHPAGARCALARPHRASRSCKHRRLG